LVLANLLVFGFGLYLTWPDKVAAKGFLQGPPLGMGKVQAAGPWNNPRVTAALEKTGLLTTSALLQGEWWRLLAAAFVHLGLLHLTMNMVGLWTVGRLVEQTWGWWRFLLIYYLSALGGSVAAAAYQPQAAMGGASGALCGLVAAFGVWLMFNGRFLPRSLVGRWRVSLIITIGLTIFLSLLPGVSGWGHLGGAVAGGAAALLLQVQRFARQAVLRGVALASVLALPATGFFVIERARATNPHWHEAEEIDFRKKYEPLVRNGMKLAKDLYHKRFNPLWERRASRRNEADIKSAIADLEKGRQELLDVGTRLVKAGPYRDEDVAEALQVGREVTAEQAELLAVYVRGLREGERWTEKDENALVAQQRKVNTLRKQWADLWER
jgi:rhomboid protease GluP